VASLISRYEMVDSTLSHINVYVLIVYSAFLEARFLEGKNVDEWTEFYVCQSKFRTPSLNSNRDSLP
jgi:hypothetical protein